MSVTHKFDHLKIPLKAIELATNKFADTNCIGSGGFGKVYKGILVVSNELRHVALKRLDPHLNQGNPEFWKEIIALSLYKHEHVVSLLGFCDERGEKILIYEYASRGSLDSYLDRDDLKWVTRFKICVGAARGLEYLHDPGSTNQRILHRDIKSANILLDGNWNAMISDFGLSRNGPANIENTFLVTNVVGTFGYVDPVYGETGLLTKESDVYSFGVVLFEILSGRKAYIMINDGDNNGTLIGFVRKYYDQDNISEIVHVNTRYQIASPTLRMFVAIAYRCLNMEPQKRPTMTEVVRELEKVLQNHVELFHLDTGLPGLVTRNNIPWTTSEEDEDSEERRFQVVDYFTAPQSHLQPQQHMAIASSLPSVGHPPYGAFAYGQPPTYPGQPTYLTSSQAFQIAEFNYAQPSYINVTFTNHINTTSMRSSMSIHQPTQNPNYHMD